MLKLPPLNALKVFEAVARLGSVKLAAKELCVTPPAISHQIGNLEQYLGEQLFIRHGKSLILSEIAQDFLTEIRPCLESIGRATAVASSRKFRDTLTISAPPTLTGTWLIPRLQSFLHQNPQLDIRFVDRMTITTEDKYVDLAIEYRYEKNPDFHSEQILNDDIVVLVSPSFQDKHQLKGLEDLQGVPLIETERRLTSWTTILSDYDWVNKQLFIRIGYSLHAFEAAARGLGVAIGNRANAQAILEQGRLVVPFTLSEESMPLTPKYFLTTSKVNYEAPKVTIFKKWLTNQLNTI